MKIKGLYEALGITPEQIEKLRNNRIATATQQLLLYTNVVGRGGNIHRVDAPATAKRRAKNKAARKARRANRNHS